MHLCYSRDRNLLVLFVKTFEAKTDFEDSMTACELQLNKVRSNVNFKKTCNQEERETKQKTREQCRNEFFILSVRMTWHPKHPRYDSLTADDYSLKPGHDYSIRKQVVHKFVVCS